MDELRPKGKETEKIVLTEEQKSDIRNEMTKCATPEEAREHRKLLAEYYGVTLKQIAAVAAYKVRPDGTLDLRPLFQKSSTTVPTAESVSEAMLPPPLMEAVYDNPTKRAWRETVRKAIAEDFSKERLERARVLCLPGQALQEVVEIYLPLGIRPENITCIERDSQVVQKMRAAANSLNLPVTIVESTVEDFLRNPHQPVTIASFDFLGQVHKSFLMSLPSLNTVDKFMVITNFLQRRETTDQQTMLKALSISVPAQQQSQRKEMKEVRVGSEIFSQNGGKSFRDQVEDILSGRTPIDLSDARDEGMAWMLRFFTISRTLLHAIDGLYAEANAAPPNFDAHERAYFIDTAVRDAATILEAEFEKRPKLYRKLTPIRRFDSAGTLTFFSNKGKHGFLQYIAHVMGLCFFQPMLCNLQRYEYSSEDSGSPYQTDILTELDMRPSFRLKHKPAYDFIRSLFRALGQYDKEAISIRIEKFGKVIPASYSDSIVGLMLVLCVNNKPQSRVSLNSLQQLVHYWEFLQSIHSRANSKGTFDRPRTKIQSP